MLLEMTRIGKLVHHAKTWCFGGSYCASFRRWLFLRTSSSLSCNDAGVIPGEENG